MFTKSNFLPPDGEEEELALLNKPIILSPSKFKDELSDSFRSRRNSKHRKSIWCLALCMVLLMIIIDVLVLLIGNNSNSIISRVYPASYLRKLHEKSRPFPSELLYQSQDDFCSVCDCSQSPMTLQKQFRTPYTSISSIPSFLFSSILDIQCKHIYAKVHIALNLIQHSIQQPDRTVAWNISSLVEQRPTSFIFTKTSPSGKTGKSRPAYIQRHVNAISTGQSMVKNATQWFDGQPADVRQTLWIIVEDDSSIDEEVAGVLALSDLNYIYFAYGPTRSFGNAQHNAAWSLIYDMTHSQINGSKPMLGHGPIVGVDDDSEIHPSLLQLIWKVKKVGMWPMGNLGPTGWEGPVFDQNGKILQWSGGNTWRKYPIDNGAFTFNSTLLGSSLLPAPHFWPTDTNGGESEFMERIINSSDELERLCDSCHVAWHNHPIGVPHIGNMTFEEGGKPW